jgi:hypothetical protein
LPNIEVYGYHVPEKDRTYNPKGAQLVADIWKALADAPYRNEVVITAIDSGSRNDPGGEEMPEAQHFVRVWATNEREVGDIIRRLEPLDIDIEVPPLLTYFIPKKSVQEAARAKLQTLQPIAGTDPDFKYPKPGAHSGE